MTTNMNTSEVKTPQAPSAANISRKRKKAEGRKKRVGKLKADKAFAKTFFEGKSKRSVDKKSAFRKKKSRKK